ncbi:MAG TPA: hypothetical protein VI753_04515, partial [Anaerolineales bacterium]|nr:hypothetical protein [Anaerolineales bacterium]
LIPPLTFHSPDTDTEDPATWYYLWVSRINSDNSLTTVIKQWYESSPACGATCSFTPDITLSTGNCRWWVQTWNDSGVMVPGALG